MSAIGPVPIVPVHYVSFVTNIISVVRLRSNQNDNVSGDLLYIFYSFHWLLSVRSKRSVPVEKSELVAPRKQ